MNYFSIYNYLPNLKNNDIINKQVTMNNEKQLFLDMINKANETYMITGSNSRSSKKVDIIHQFIEDTIKPLLKNNMEIKQEQNIPSNNSKNRKKCDIVIYKDNIPYIILPVKYTMTSYNKNSNNYWENIQGELMSLKTQAAIYNTDLYIIPINIIANNIPNRSGSDKKIKNFEKINYQKSYQIYESMKNIPSGTLNNISPLCYDCISYIIDVEHICQIGDHYDKCPKIIDFNSETPYRDFKDILKPIL